MRRLAIFALAVAAQGFAAATANSQTTTDLHVRLDAGNGMSINGALVAIVDGDRAVSEGLSSGHATITLSATPGTYRVRVRRIGFRPFLSDPVTLPFKGELLLHVSTDHIVLDAMIVSASAQCGAIKRDAQTLSTVWEEITKALRASQLTPNDLGRMGKMRTYKRELGQNGEVISTQTSLLTITNQRPFGVPDPPSLAQLGYVRGTPQTGWEYFGPDEAVLLSNEFAATHCFKVVRDKKKRAGQIGVAFEPAPKRKLSDIKGVLWVDEKTAELRDIGFVYVNAGILTNFEPGGFTKFRRVASGTWIVSEWQLRMPKLEVRVGYRDYVSQIGMIENGGIIVADDAPARGGTTATVSGTVWDSVSQTGVSGATVTLENATARTDDSGRFKFAAVPVGTRILSLSGPMVSAFGLIAMEKEIEVTGDTTQVMAALPSFASVWKRICADSVPEEGHGILHGFVRTANGDPVENAKIKVRWRELPTADGGARSLERLSLQVASDRDGHYVACGFRPTAQGDVSASLSGNNAEERPFSFRTGYLLRRDLVVSSDRAITRPKDRREIVVAVTDPAGMPLPDALTFIDGSTETAHTDDEGHASLTTSNRELAIGVRRVGYAQQILTVKLGETQRQLLRVVLRPAQTLATVNVVARAPMPLAIERRRDQGRGTFYGPEEIAAVHGLRTLISRAPGAKVEGVGRWLLKFKGTGGGDCVADLYIDGRLSAPYVEGKRSSAEGAKKFEELDTYGPDDVYAMEVYPRASEAPPQYAGVRDGCGVLMVWTRGYAESEIERQERRGAAIAKDSAAKK